MKTLSRHPPSLHLCRRNFRQKRVVPLVLLLDQIKPMVNQVRRDAVPGLSSDDCGLTILDLSKHFITMESMQAVKAQLLNLASKNKDLKASMQEMRQSVVDELFSHLKVRQIAIGQLGRDDLDDEIRKLCVKALKDRKSSISRKEGELLQLENAFSRHVAIFDFTDRACLELEEKIKVYEEAVIGHGLRLGLSMSGEITGIPAF